MDMIIYILCRKHREYIDDCLKYETNLVYLYVCSVNIQLEGLNVLRLDQYRKIVVKHKWASACGVSRIVRQQHVRLAVR